MSIELSDVEAIPGEDIKLRIHTDPGSCVCLGAVDRSLYLLHPDYILSKDEVNIYIYYHLLYHNPFVITYNDS